MAAAEETDVVFNVVYTPGTFRYLRWFALSILDHSQARLRLVANGCAAKEIAHLEEMAQRFPSRIAGVSRLPSRRMLKHGLALNELYDRHDDGRFFAFVDSDMKAKGPFLGDLLQVLSTAAAVTSGQPGWLETDVLPPSATGVGGAHIFGADGYVYGSSYLAIYDRQSVDATRARRGIGFEQYQGKTIPPVTKEELRADDRLFMLFDTAKLLNVCLQFDGSSVHHVVHPNLVHIGGMSRYLSTSTRKVTGPVDGATQSSTQPGAIARFNHASYAALTLRGLIEGTSLPELPDTQGDNQALLRSARDELVELAHRYGEQ